MRCFLDDLLLQGCDVAVRDDPSSEHHDVGGLAALELLGDRLEVLGGVVDVSSAPGTGARVAGWVPLST
jgi:hypothetical protein